jgi:tetratricopeptide (TPR) repeat protein
MTGYAMTIEYRMFSLRDLASGEDLARVRGTPGTYQMIGGDWEQRLERAVAARPDDPELQYAVGEWLSRMNACGCGRPERFKGAADDFQHFERALRGGVSDAWSLFRMGVHHVSGPRPDLRAGVDFFERSLALAPDDVDAHYNEAVALLWLKDYAGARNHSAKALGKYADPQLAADAFHLHAEIEAALGDAAAAERAYREAMKLRPAHALAFQGLLDLLRAQGRVEEYRQVALAFIALDYGNTWPFQVYLKSVDEAGPIEADRALARELAAREYAGDREIGAVFYGLGLLAERDGDRAEAHARYVRSLEALRRQKPPPEGAVEALEKLVAETRGK